MTLRDLLADLSRAGIKLRAEGDKLDIRAPRGAITPELRTLLSEQKAELLELLRSNGHASAAAPQTVAPDPEHRFDPFPMTEIEQAYWVGRRGGVGMHAYFEIDCPDWDRGRFEGAWNSLVQRHEMLRAVALPSGERRILEHVPHYEIAVDDLCGRDSNDIEAHLMTLRDRLACQVLPLEHWPLFEVRAAQLQPRLYRVFLSVDCTFLDAWSFQTLLRELIHLYKTPDIALDPIELSYRDYVLAAGHLRETDVYARSIEYWRERVRTLPSAPELPRVKTPSLLGQLRFQRFAGHLEQAARARLQEQAARYGMTLPGLLLAAYAEVLARWSKTQRFTLNIPLFNRQPLHPHVNRVIGTFSSFILVECERRAGEGFAQRARRVQDQLWRDLEHRHVPGTEVLRELVRGRGGIESAMMPVVFTSFPSGADGRGCSWLGMVERELGTVRHVVTQTPQVWIDHHAVYEGETLYFSWDVAIDLFPPGMAGDMFAAYEQLLQRLAVDDEAWEIASPVVLSDDQLAARRTANDTAAPVAERLLHDRFFELADAEPDRTAVISGSVRLTYGELAHRAKVVAERLRAGGAAAREPVAVVMEKGWEQVVGALGVMASGSPYVPIDPAAPRERLEYLLKDTGVRFVLTQDRLERSLPWPEGIAVLNLTELDYTAKAGTIEPQTPDDLAVIIYTSGSTGRPNGVMLMHRGLVNAIDQTIQRFHLTPEDRAFAITNLHHDMSLFDVFGMLSCGGSMVVPEPDRRRDPSHWAELLRRERVTVWNSVPATMSMLVEYERGRTGAAPALRLVLLGGDVIPITLPDQIRALRPGIEVSSVGGPTETTLWNIWYPIGKVDPDWRTIPYGRPVANTKYYVLNDSLEDCPVWVPGEICSWGIGNARGYWNNPEKTASKFVTHPASGERIYRTGDLGRYLPDGNIEFLGRMDFQLSIGGYRIEPGEIEAALTQHPAVKDAVVIAAGEGNHKRLVAYVIASAGERPDAGELRRFAESKLPAHMAPRSYVFLDALPLSPTGKLDRNALPAPDGAGSQPEADQGVGDAAIENRLSSVICEVLGLSKVERGQNFFDLGANSVHLVQVHVKLKDTYGVEIPIIDLFQHPTIAALARSIAKPNGQPTATKVARKQSGAAGGIAIVGMSGRFPGARNVEEFWQNLVEARESVEFFGDEELRAAGISAAMLRNPNYVKAGAPLEDIDQFDAEFFGMSPREAQNTDPQQRLFLECAWEALEDAGCAPDSVEGMIGVYAGKTMSNYLYPNLGDLIRPADFFQTLIGNDKDFIATQISYKLNLRGPSVAVQTACSTSLVAAAMACQALENGDCDMALAGGVSLKIPHRLGYLYEEGSVFSVDGHCRVFDERAQGTVPGSGVGVAVLKRLEDAVADGDSIYAVIKGWALNNDGANKVGFTAPSVEGQAAVIAAAQARAGVEASSISYVEAHGTGTPMGDPIEVAALARAFRGSTDQRHFCALGSVKSNIGHLDSAAGIASLMKTALALRHQTIPASLFYERPNPRIDFESSPFYVSARTTSWESGQTPRRAGVSSFGIGGTNAHLVLEEAPQDQREQETERPWDVLTLSAKSDAALLEQARRYQTFLANAGDRSFADICYSSAVGRTHFGQRLALVAASAEDAEKQLTSFLEGNVEGVARGSSMLPPEPAIAFLFTGQGSQYAGMGRQLFETEPVFRRALEECDDILRPLLNPSLMEVLYPESGRGSPIDEITYAQPVLFALEYALAQLWRSWGIEPATVMGHSTGEYVAACVAGVFSLTDGLRLVAARGRLMETFALVGETLAVFALEATVAEALRPLSSELAIAAINGPENMVVSGAPRAIQSAIETFSAMGIETRRLNIPRAAHSPLMEPMLRPFAKEAARVRYEKPTIPLISNLTGQPVGDEIATPEYWLRQVRHTVQFAAGIETLHRRGCQVYIEIGPKPTLIGMGPQCVPDSSALWLPSLRPGHEDRRQMLESLSSLHAAGAKVDWRRLDPERRRRKVALPTYAFQRRRYWSPGAGLLPAAAGTERSSQTLHPLLGRRLAVALPDGSRVFESRLSQDEPEYLRHHRVFDHAILPAAAYLEIACAAVRAAGGEGAIRLEDVLLQKAVVLPEEGSRTVQCLLTPSKDGGQAFQISSLTEDSDGSESEWILHASGNILVEQDNSGCDRVDLSALRERFAEEVDVPHYYGLALAAGTNFGAPFQGIAQLWTRPDESLGRIELPAELRPEAPDHTFHPAFLDACFQVIGTAFPPLGPDETFLPVGVERFTIFGSPGERLWSHATLHTAEGGEQTLKADLRLIADDGKVVALVEGLLLQRAVPATFLRSKRELLQHWLYEVAWRAKTVDAAATPNVPRGWLILADRGGVGQRLATLLKAQGDECVIAHHDETRDDFTRLLGRCDAVLPQPRGIVHLWSLDAVGLADASEAGCGSTLQLVRTLLAMWPSAPQLSLVTGNAASDGVAQSPLAGFARSLGWEHPEFGAKCIDIDPRTPVQAAAFLFDEVRSGPGEELVAYRGDARYVARLARAQAPRQSSGEIFHADATYLISGGLGRLGRVVAEWLVARGAGHVVLLARGAADGIELKGERTSLIRCDIADRSEVERALRELSATLPPLRGVWHLAGRIDDGTVQQQTWERVAAVLAPKVDGAWHLHTLTQEMPLDHFVMFSSVAALLGSPGQASHAAANAFLDGLAHHRRSLGLPALSINWGPWAGLGPSPKPGKTKMEGIGSLTADQGLAILEHLLADPPAQVGVVPITWPRFLRQFAPRPYLSELADATAATPEPGIRMVERLEQAPVDQRLGVLAAHVSSQLATILGLAPSEFIDPRKGLFSMGLDSLASLVLRNRLQSSLQCTLPSTLVFNYPNIDAITGFLAQSRLAHLFQPAPNGNSGLTAQLDEMSHEDLATMLAARIASAG